MSKSRIHDEAPVLFLGGDWVVRETAGMYTVAYQAFGYDLFVLEGFESEILRALDDWTVDDTAVARRELRKVQKELKMKHEVLSQNLALIKSVLE